MPSHRLRIQRDDGSDIRTVWELSRCYYFLALARAYWATGDSTYRETFVRHVESWIADNPVGLGPHWASPMDVAIRSANWVLATVLLGPAVEIPDGFWARLLGNLYASGLFLERHPEWHPVYRGNHYVADGLGLVYLGVLFRGDPAGERWLRRGARILAREICHQVHDDGVSFEAALGYHRLVTEFFAYGGELLRLNVPGAAGAEYEARVRSMYRFIRQYLPDSGEAPMLGDADDGRLHAVSARGLLEPRRHALGLPERFWPESVEEGAIAFPQGGYYVLRKERDHAIIRCGAVGLNGAGSHDHADQLAFELVLGGRRVVADSGTYAYTRDLAARFAFRSSAAHGVVQVGSEEQNPIRVDRPWRVLADRTRARCVLCTQTATELRFEGVHYGYAHRPSRAVCRRAITVDIADGEWQVVDTIDGVGRESITWRLHLAPTLVEWRCTGPGTYEFLLPGSPAVRIALQVPAAMEPRVEESFMSDRYGVRVARPCITAAGELALPVSVIVTFLAGR
ncbi:MAG: alginate lyase family protein [Gemmatimonadetes bacterium]|nr:alginate lyase family protein [Gemmatimonadota bacterium]